MSPWGSLRTFVKDKSAIRVVVHVKYGIIDDVIMAHSSGEDIKADLALLEEIKKQWIGRAYCEWRDQAQKADAEDDKQEFENAETVVYEFKDKLIKHLTEEEGMDLKIIPSALLTTVAILIGERADDVNDLLDGISHCQRTLLRGATIAWAAKEEGEATDD
jgi:hypothetical protein